MSGGPKRQQGTNRKDDMTSLLRNFYWILLVLLGSIQSANGDSHATNYLGFQVFIGESDPTVFLGASQGNWTSRNASSGAVGGAPLSSPPSKALLASFAQRIIDKIGSTGQGRQRLTLIFGPLAFDQTDADIARVVGDIFDIALEKNVAVGFHIDDSKFWSRRSDLWQNADNVEWLDWSGTPSKGMALPWGVPPPKLAPPMCFNSKQIISAVQRLGRDVIGAAIKQGIDRLTSRGRPDLFSVVIMGWETAMGRDYHNSALPLGFCALTNLGFGKGKPPKDRDSVLEAVVHDFIQLWAKSLTDAGIPQAKIFGHVAYLHPAMLPQALKARRLPASQTYSEVMGFAPLKVTFNNPYLNPGLSYYGEDLTGIYDQFQSAGITRWAACEGVNVDPSMTMETYLAKIFNHKGVLATIFGWGVGPDDQRNPFRYAAERSTAIDAYRKFLSGARLVESPSPSPTPSPR